MVFKLLILFENWGCRHRHAWRFLDGNAPPPSQPRRCGELTNLKNEATNEEPSTFDPNWGGKDVHMGLLRDSEQVPALVMDSGPNYTSRARQETTM